SLNAVKGAENSKFFLSALDHRVLIFAALPATAIDVTAVGYENACRRQCGSSLATLSNFPIAYGSGKNLPLVLTPRPHCRRRPVFR
mgnify:CR=1